MRSEFRRPKGHQQAQRSDIGRRVDGVGVAAIVKPFRRRADAVIMAVAHARSAALRQRYGRSRASAGRSRAHARCFCAALSLLQLSVAPGSNRARSSSCFLRAVLWDECDSCAVQSLQKLCDPEFGAPRFVASDFVMPPPPANNGATGRCAASAGLMGYVSCERNAAEWHAS